MWRAMVDEARRALALSREGAREILSGRARKHPAWLADDHLRRGFLLALPFYLVGLPIVIALTLPPFFVRHDPWPFIVLGMPFSCGISALWLFFAARSRAGRNGR